MPGIRRHKPKPSSYMHAYCSNYLGHWLRHPEMIDWNFRGPCVDCKRVGVLGIHVKHRGTPTSINAMCDDCYKKWAGTDDPKTAAGKKRVAKASRLHGTESRDVRAGRRKSSTVAGSAEGVQHAVSRTGRLSEGRAAPEGNRRGKGS